MFSTNIKIYFFDADPAGISFYGNIFKYAHAAYEEFMQSFNDNKNLILNNEYLLPIFKTNANFLKPMSVGENIKIELFLTSLKEYSFEISYNFFNSKNELTAKVQTVHVSVSATTFKKSRLPEELKTKLALHLIEKV